MVVYDSKSLEVILEASGSLEAIVRVSMLDIDYVSRGDSWKILTWNSVMSVDTARLSWVVNL